jgi:hypothetical protein
LLGLFLLVIDGLRGLWRWLVIFGYWLWFVAVGVGGIDFFGAEFLNGRVAGQFIFLINKSVVINILFFKRLLLVLAFEFGQVQGSVS